MTGTAHSRRVLISGAGIAGLSLAVLLKERGFEPVMVERDTELRTEGYMMDFFGTGWDVAERMKLTDELRAVTYPIERMEFVDRDGKPYISVPIERVRKALGHKYVFLRRPDLQQILLRRAKAQNLAIRFDTTVTSIGQDDAGVTATFSDGSEERFDLVFGADGVHSQVRALVFGDEGKFARHLGATVAALHLPGADLGLDRAFKLHEEIDWTAGYYPLGDGRTDATFIFRHTDAGRIPEEERMPLLRKIVSGPGWISGKLLAALPSSLPVYFDSLTQIVMPNWTHGRVALIGDACGCLTLLAGQGSQMAMGDAFVLASELERHGGDHAAAFAAYEATMKTPTEKKQREAQWFSRVFIRSAKSRPWVRALTTRLFFSRLLLATGLGSLGGRSELERYHA